MQRRGPVAKAVTGFAVLLVFCTLVGLGVWQIERRSWKHELIERVDTRIHAPVADAPAISQWPEITRENAEYRHVWVSGVFEHGQESLVQAVTTQGAGFWVLTPLRTSQGFTVLINRGFVPPEKRDPSMRGAGQPAGQVEVFGLLRLSEPGGAFLRTNAPAEGRWYSRDVAAIAAAKGLSDVAPYFIDADARPNPGGYPVGGLTVVNFPDNHLVYALTWFGLAALLASYQIAAGRTRALQGKGE